MAGSITIQYCNIEKVETECMVNAANSALHYGSGVCHAIFTGAGRSAMQAACDKIGHCEVGSAVVTPAFHLPAKYVIHAVGPYTSDANALELLRSAYLSAMALVQKLGCHRVTFPLISSGAFNDAGWHYEPLWNAAISAVQDYQVANSEYPIDVLFACHGHELIDVGKKVLASPPAVRMIPPAFPQRDADLGGRNAEQAGPIKTRYRIFVAPMGGFRDSANYEFVAEFGQQKLARNYVSYMGGKKRYSGKAIIVREVTVKRTGEGEQTSFGNIVGLIASTGEELLVEAYEFV